MSTWGHIHIHLVRLHSTSIHAGADASRYPILVIYRGLLVEKRIEFRDFAAQTTSTKQAGGMNWYVCIGRAFQRLSFQPCFFLPVTGSLAGVDRSIWERP